MSYTCSKCKQQGHNRRNCTSVEPTPAPTVDEISEDEKEPRRDIVIVRDCPLATAQPIERILLSDKPKHWSVYIVHGVEDGVWLALATNAHAVIFIEGDKSKAGQLKSHVSRLKNVLDAYVVVAAPVTHGADLSSVLRASNANMAITADYRDSTDLTSRLDRGMADHNHLVAPPEPGERRADTGVMLFLSKPDATELQSMGTAAPAKSQQDAMADVELAVCYTCGGMAPNAIGWASPDACSKACAEKQKAVR